MMNQQMLMKMRKMQREMEEAQKRLAETTYEGSAGGVVKVSMLGNHTVTKITIDKNAIEGPDDVEMLEDTILAAINDATNKLDADAEKTLGAFTGGLPGGLF